MPYEKRVSSRGMLKMLEKRLHIGSIDVPLNGQGWVISAGFRNLIGLTDSDTSDVVNAIAASLHLADRQGFLRDVALLQSGFAPPLKTIRVINPNALARFVSLQFEPLLDDDGEAKSFIGIAQDVTREQQMSHVSESATKRVDQMMEALDIHCFWRKDVGGGLFDCSVRGHLSRKQTVLGRAWVDTIREDQRTEVLSSIAEATASNRPYVLPVTITGEDGKDRDYLSKGFPLKDQYGNISEWYGIVSEKQSDAIKDITVNNIADAAALATGGTVRALCALMGWTYDEAASRSGLSTTTVSRFVLYTGLLVEKFRKKSIESLFAAFFAAGACFYIINDKHVSFCRTD